MPLHRLLYVHTHQIFLDFPPQEKREAPCGLPRVHQHNQPSAPQTALSSDRSLRITHHRGFNQSEQTISWDWVNTHIKRRWENWATEVFVTVRCWSITFPPLGTGSGNIPGCVWKLREVYWELPEELYWFLPWRWASVRASPDSDRNPVCLLRYNLTSPRPYLLPPCCRCLNPAGARRKDGQRRTGREGVKGRRTACSVVLLHCVVAKIRRRSWGGEVRYDLTVVHGTWTHCGTWTKVLVKRHLVVSRHIALK